MVARVSSRSLGLEVGARSIKLIEVEHTPQGPRLLKSLAQDLPAPAEGRVMDLAGWLQSVLTECSGRDVHVALSGSDVAIRRIHVPLMPKHELPEAVKWQVKEQLPFPVKDAAIDFRVLGEVWEKDVKKLDVLVAAASRSAIEERVSAVERAGGRVASLTPGAAASWRCLTALIPEAGTGSVALIEIGTSKTDVTIAKDGHPRLVRELGIGSGRITEALIGMVTSDSKEVAIDVSKAEALKRRYGLLGAAAEGMTEEGIPLAHLAALMRPVLEQLLTEISRMVDFYKAQGEESGVSRLYLCGGGATLEGLQGFLSDGLGIKTELFNPLQRVTAALPLSAEQVAETGPRMASALGLALDRGQGLNLLPRDLRRKRETAASTRAWAPAAKGCVAVAVVVYLALQGWAWQLQGQLRDAERQWSRLEPAHADYMRITAARKSLETGRSQLQRVVDGQPVWDGVLKEVAGLMPPAIELDEVTVIEAEDGALQVRLKGRGTGEGRDSSIAQLMEALERSIFFHRVQMVSSELTTGESGMTRFELEGNLE